ncbi:hypothetical protein ACJX0J_036800, partial [Zea mays]
DQVQLIVAFHFADHQYICNAIEITITFWLFSTSMTIVSKALLIKDDVIAEAEHTIAEAATSLAILNLEYPIVGLQANKLITTTTTLSEIDRLIAKVAPEKNTKGTIAPETSYAVKDLLLSKALKLQQDDEDRKNKFQGFLILNPDVRIEKAASEEASHSVKDIPGALGWIEKEIEDLDEIFLLSYFFELTSQSLSNYSEKCL